MSGYNQALDRYGCIVSLFWRKTHPGGIHFLLFFERVWFVLYLRREEAAARSLEGHAALRKPAPGACATIEITSDRPVRPVGARPPLNRNVSPISPEGRTS